MTAYLGVLLFTVASALATAHGTSQALREGYAARFGVGQSADYRGALP